MSSFNSEVCKLNKMSEIEWLDIFGDNLYQMLDDVNMSQRELADAIGADESTISRIINKQRMPNIKHIVNIAYVLNCNIADLMDFGDMIE